MANYLPFLKPNYISKDGTTPIYVRYNYDRIKRTLIPIGYSIKPDLWDGKKNWIKRACPQFEEIDAALTKLTSKLGNILTYAKENDIEPEIDFVISELEKDRNYEHRSNRLNMLDTLEQYIVQQKRIVSPARIKDYSMLRKHLTKFKEHSSQPVSFRNLNLKFYNEFMDYLYTKAEKPDKGIGLLTNSAGKVIQMLKAFVNSQVANGIIPAVDLKSFKVVEEETDSIYLTELELSKIYNLDLSADKELEGIRDILILGCYTGLRYSDLSILNSDQINLTNQTISIRQTKVNKGVTIPMIDYVPDILLKHNYCMPEIAYNVFNFRLKEIGQIAEINQMVEVIRMKGTTRITKTYPKWQLMSSHVCRRSFCTNLYLGGFPPEELMRISGHKKIGTLLSYIKIDNSMAAERLRANRANLANKKLSKLSLK
jgi:integrase